MLNKGETWAQTNLVVELAVETLSISIYQFERMRAVAIHMTIAIGQTSITE